MSPSRAEDGYFQKKIQKNSESRFRDLKEFKWKPGFEQIPSSPSSSSSSPKQNRELKLVESKDKETPLSLSTFAYKPNRGTTAPPPKLGSVSLLQEAKQPKS
jgi:hypothetical protein